jgi:hypothetical protein
MRISSFLHYLEEIESLLHIDSKEVTSNNTTYITINNWGVIHDALLKLAKYQFIYDDVEQLLQLGPHFNSSSIALTVDRSNYTFFKQKHTIISSKIITSIKLLNEFSGEESENQLNVKLPDNLSLKDMASMISDLDFVFGKCHFFVELNDKNSINVIRVDSGSIWLILAVASAVVVLIGQIVKVAFGISEQYLKQQEFKQRLRVFKKGASFIEEIDREFKQKISDEIREKADKIVSENMPDSENRNEEINSLYFGIEKLADLMFRGVEIYASLEAPKEVTELFPKQEETLTLAKEILKLKSSNE